MGTPGTSTLTLVYLADVDPLATCNDGSPAGYYFAPGSGSSSNLWVVYLEGRRVHPRLCARGFTSRRRGSDA